jgi:hypothetical protein
MNRLLSLLAVALIATAGSSASAMDWLSPHLESQRQQNIQRHQQEGARSRQKQQVERPSAKRPSQARPMSPRAEAQARAEGKKVMQSHRPRMEREHKRRVQRDGRASADRWLKAEAFALGERVGKQMRAKYAGR